jgi:hypothetical protein
LISGGKKGGLDLERPRIGYEYRVRYPSFTYDIVVVNIEEWQEGCFWSVLMSENDIEGFSFDIEGKTYDIVPNIVYNIVYQIVYTYPTISEPGGSKFV